MKKILFGILLFVLVMVLTYMVSAFFYKNNTNKQTTTRVGMVELKSYEKGNRM